VGDLVYLALTVVFFVVSLGYAVYCGRLLPPDAA